MVLTPRAVPPCYLYASLTTDDFVEYLTSNADGSAYPAVRPERFATAQILLPPTPVLERFEAAVSRLRERIGINERESRALAAARDGLLPKLLSGEVRVQTQATDNGPQRTRELNLAVSRATSGG